MAKILRCIDETKSMRFFIAFTDDLVNDYNRLQKASISSTVEMGKVLTMNALMYSDLKNTTDSIDIKLKTNGLSGLVISKLYNNSFVTGYMENKLESSFDKVYKNGKASKEFVGDDGIMVITKDLGLKNPYIGQTKIISSNISENFTNHFSSSNQVPTTVFLDTLYTDKGYVGYGVMGELMPFYTEKDFAQFNIYFEMFKSELSNYVNGDFKDISFYDYIVSVLEIFNIKITEEKIIHYKCSCNEEKITTMLRSLGKKELLEIIDEGKDLEVVCNFCDKKYVKSVDEIKKIISNL